MLKSQRFTLLNLYKNICINQPLDPFNRVDTMPLHSGIAYHLVYIFIIRAFVVTHMMQKIQQAYSYLYVPALENTVCIDVGERGHKVTLSL